MTLFCSQGTVNNQTGIFPEYFVKVIKPLPEDEGGVATSASCYSCLRCYLLSPSGVDTRCVCVLMCVCESVYLFRRPFRCT